MWTYVHVLQPVPRESEHGVHLKVFVVEQQQLVVDPRRSFLLLFSNLFLTTSLFAPFGSSRH